LIDESVHEHNAASAQADGFVVLLGRLPVSEGDERAVTHGCPLWTSWPCALAAE
jgi:hypothetical protein